MKRNGQLASGQTPPQLLSSPHFTTITLVAVVSLEGLQYNRQVAHSLEEHRLVRAWRIPVVS